MHAVSDEISAFNRFARAISGADQLKDELSFVDLGHSEKRFNRPVQLTTHAENLSLQIRQRQALNWIHRNTMAAMNRAHSCRVLLAHAALRSVIATDVPE